MDFNKQQEYIKSILLRFTKDKWLIDELCQVVNIKLHNSKIKDRNKGLLYSTIKTVYIDHFRHTKSQRANVLVYKDWDGESSLRPDDILVTKENKDILSREEIQTLQKIAEIKRKKKPTWGV